MEGGQTTLLCDTIHYTIRSINTERCNRLYVQLLDPMDCSYLLFYTI